MQITSPVRVIVPALQNGGIGIIGIPYYIIAVLIHVKNRECVSPLEIRIAYFNALKSALYAIIAIQEKAVPSRICHTRNLVPLVLYILEIIEALVVPLVLHPPDHALSVSCISPRETLHVIVEAILQFPSVQFTITEVGIPRMDCRVSVLVQCFLIIGGDYHVKRMSRAPRLSLRRGRHKVRYSVLPARSQLTPVTQRLEFSPCNLLCGQKPRNIGLYLLHEGFQPLVIQILICHNILF